MRFFVFGYILIFLKIFFFKWQNADTFSAFTRFCLAYVCSSSPPPSSPFEFRACQYPERRWRVSRVSSSVCGMGHGTGKHAVRRAAFFVSTQTQSLAVAECSRLILVCTSPHNPFRPHPTPRLQYERPARGLPTVAAALSFFFSLLF